MISVAKVGIEHLEYYLATARDEEEQRLAAAAGAANYYGSDTPIGAGVWLHAGAMGVNAGAQVSPTELRDMLAGRDPGSGEQLGRTYKAGAEYVDRRGITRRRRSVSAYDLTVSMPKSVSAAWAIAPAEVRAEIEQAFLASVDAAVTYLQQRAVVSRKGDGGVISEPVPDGATVAAFVHTTSRTGDPQLHAHTLWGNRVLCEDGTWRTIDGRALFAHAKAASVLSSAVLRAEITSRLGWAWDHVDERHHADLAGAPNELLDAWSQRRRAIERKAADDIAEFERVNRCEPTPEQRRQIYDDASLATRAAKTSDVEDPHERWADEAAAAGCAPADVLDRLDAAEVPEAERYALPELVVSDPHDPAAALDAGLADALLAHVEVTKTRLTDADLDAAAAAAIAIDPDIGFHPASDPGGPTPTEYVTAAVAKLRESLTSRLTGTPSQDPASYAAQQWHSDGLVAAETAVGEWLRAPCAEPAGVSVAELDTEGLSPDQAAAAQLVTEAGYNGVAVVGIAGSGKTTTLERIAEAVGHDNVLALAPTATAADTLSEKIGTAAVTVALANVTSSPDQSPIPRGGLVIVDEATQLGTRDLATLAGHCAARGARVAFVGDHAQQGSVAAGAVFDVLTSRQDIPTAALSRAWRFKDPDEAAATAQLRLGKPEALDYHRQRGRVSDGAAAHAPRIAGEWWSQHRDADTLISASRLETTALINTEIAERRAEIGQTGEVVATIGQQPIRVGDIIVSRKNDRRLVTAGGRTVKNGDRWRVDAGSKTGGLVVTNLDNPNATVILPRRYVAKRVQLGYAITHTRAQSLTVDHSLTFIDAGTAREPLYVGMSRGALSNHLHIITDVAGHDPDAPTEHLPADQVLKAVLERTQLRRTAADIANSAAHDSPALHLDLIAQTPHNKPLPVPDGFDGSRWLATPHTDLSAGVASVDTLDQDFGDSWVYEAEVQAAMAEWLDEQRHDDIADRIESGAYDDAAAAATLDESLDSLDQLPPELDPELFLSEELAGLDHPDHPDPLFDHERDHSLHHNHEPDYGHDAAHHYEGDPEMATLTATRPHSAARHHRTAAPADPRARVGIDVEAVQAAVRQRGLATWIANRFSVKAAKRTGSRVPIECPLHRPGHTRSAVVYTDGSRDTFTCFRCGESGLDAIALVEKHDSVPFGEALKSLAAELGVTATTTIGPARPVEPPIDLRPTLTIDQVLPGAPTSAASQAHALLASLDAPDGTHTPHPAWTQAAAAHHHASATGDDQLAGQAAALIAAMADPSTAARLAAAGIDPDPAGATIRTQIVAHRWAAHHETLNQLTELLRSHTPATAVPERDWAAAVERWLDDPAAHPISASWAELHDTARPERPRPEGHDTIEDLARLYELAAAQPPAASGLPTPELTPASAATAHTPGAAADHADDDQASAKGYAALDRAAAWYRAQLQGDTPAAAAARRYLAGRGIDAGACEQWGIGWAPDTWQSMCDHIGDDQLAYDIGVAARSDSGRTFDFMRGRVTFELRTPAGQVIGFAGRSLDPDEDAKYINTRNGQFYAKSQTLYGADQAAAAINATGTAVVVEGYTDVIASHQAGVANTVAACGTALGDAHLDTLAALGATQLTALFDADEAGRNATNRLAQRAAEHQLPTSAARLPAGSDPADVTPDELTHTIANAEPPLLTALHAALAGHDPADARSTARQLAAALDTIDLDDPVTAALARSHLTAALGANWHHAVRRTTPNADRTTAPARTRTPASIA